ncbi:MAG: hypothetical protein ACJASW_001139 [Polaribacter sp.]|jgi:hypothetical protein
MGHPDDCELRPSVYQVKKLQAASRKLQHDGQIVAVLNDRGRAQTLDAAPMFEKRQSSKPRCSLQLAA